TVRIFTNLVGTSDASLRWFGFLVGVALLVIAWFNARTSHRDVPLILPALIGLNVSFLIDGTWIRGYGLGWLFIALAVGLTWHFLAQPNVPRLIAMFLAYIAGMQSLVFDAALFPALLAAAFVVCVLRQQWKWALMLCLVGVFCAISYLPEFLTYREIKSWTVLLQYPISAGLVWHEFQIACGQPVPVMAGVWLLFVTMSILGAALFTRRSWVSHPGLLLFGLLTVLIAVTTYYTFLGISHTAPQTRYHLAILILLAAVAELIVATLCRFQSWIRLARLLLVIALAISSPFFLWPKITE